jgi:hypothetical protein
MSTRGEGGEGSEDSGKIHRPGAGTGCAVLLIAALTFFLACSLASAALGDVLNPHPYAAFFTLWGTIGFGAGVCVTLAIPGKKGVAVVLVCLLLGGVAATLCSILWWVSKFLHGY